jgi:hypothetical protein
MEEKDFEIDFSTISPPALVVSSDALSEPDTPKIKTDTIQKAGSVTYTPEKKIDIDKYFNKEFIKNYFL